MATIDAALAAAPWWHCRWGHGSAAVMAPCGRCQRCSYAVRHNRGVGSCRLETVANGFIPIGVTLVPLRGVLVLRVLGVYPVQMGAVVTRPMVVRGRMRVRCPRIAPSSLGLLPATSKRGVQHHQPRSQQLPQDLALRCGCS